MDGVINVGNPVSAGKSPPALMDDIRNNFVETAVHIANTTDAHGLAVVIALLNAAVAEVAAGRGSRAGLAQRLDMALNQDGTLKANVTLQNLSEWVDPQWSPGKVDAYSFTVPGDQTGLMVHSRKVLLSDGVSTAYGMVKGSTYNGSTMTTVVLYDAAVMNNPSSVKYGIITPGAAGSLDLRAIVPANYSAATGGF